MGLANCVLTFIVFGERVCVDDVETSDTEQLLALDKVLPFAFEYLDTVLSVPALVPHVLQHVGVWLDYHMK